MEAVDVSLASNTSNLLGVIFSQFGMLYWPLIISGAGIGEIYNHRQSQLAKGKMMPWYFPLIIGFIFGGMNYLDNVNWGAKDFNVLHVIFGTGLSGFVYSGLISLAYILLIKPFKIIMKWFQERKKGSN